jgi:SOS response regulatory protein OraA/RecX
LFNKKLKSIKNKSINNAISSIKQYIISKGYKIEIVNHLVEESKEMIYKLIPEDEALEKDYLTAKRKYSKDKTKEKQNILAYLLRKGYTYNKIKTRMEADHE